MLVKLLLGASTRLQPKPGLLLLLPSRVSTGSLSGMPLAEGQADPKEDTEKEKEAAEEERPVSCPEPSLDLGPGVSVTRLSATVRLYRPPSDSSGCSPAPLVLLLPWFGAPPRAVAKYLSLYLSGRRWPVLVAESRVGHFLWPRWGLDYAGRLLGLLREGGPLGEHPLLVHAFSIGGYVFAQMMVRLQDAPQDHQGVKQRIRGLVYDSLVAGDLEDMARGVSQMTTASPTLQPLLRRGTLLYFRLFSRCTVSYFQAALEVFHRPPLHCPALVFFCHNDPLSDPRVMGQLLDSWRAAGIAVRVQEWPVSRHAGHLRLYPQDYSRALDAFLRDLDLGPPAVRAKL
ncbi:transmembrane protein 53-A-like [Anolis sagrei]|uniref:transmembrane protein 53-A-like n=1 Tax=Anolis sagrei TaxID=38937 RepID=UPI00352201BC